MKKFVYQEQGEPSNPEIPPDKPDYRALTGGESGRPKGVCLHITDDILEMSRRSPRLRTPTPPLVKE